MNQLWVCFYLEWIAVLQNLWNVTDTVVDSFEGTVVFIYQTSDVSVPVIFSLTEFIFPLFLQLFTQQLQPFLISGLNVWWQKKATFMFQRREKWN